MQPTLSQIGRVIDWCLLLATLAFGYAVISHSIVDSTKQYILNSAFVLTVVIACSIAIDNLRKIEVIFSAKTFFLLGYAIFIVIGMLKNVIIYDEVTETRSLDNAKIACILAIAMLALFLFGYHFPGRYGGQRGSHIEHAFSIEKLRQFGVFFFLLGLAGLAAYNPVLFSEQKESSDALSRFPVYFPIISGILIFFVLIRTRAGGWSRHRLFLAALFFVDLAITVTRTSRYVSFYLIFFAIFYYLYEKVYFDKMKIRRKHIVGVCVIFSCLYVLGTAIKVLAVTGWDLDLIVGLDPELIGDVLWRLYEIQFVDAFDNLIRIVDWYPSTDRYTYGDSFLAGLLNFIPRSLWETKPLALGVTLAEGMMGLSAGNSVAPSLVGELTAGFGYFGVFLGLLAGLVVRYLDRINQLSIRTSPTNQIYMIPLFYLIAMEQRGDFSLTADGIYIILPLVIVVYLSRKKIRRDGMLVSK